MRPPWAGVNSKILALQGFLNYAGRIHFARADKIELDSPRG